MKTYTLFALICLSILTPSLFGQTNTSPAIPEEARKHFVMGTTLFKDAKTTDDYSLVVNEFKQATDLAPQWPDARYNLALAKEAASDYSGAMADLKLYQQFKLSDTEARTVQDKIYSLEAKATLVVKKKAEEEQKKTNYSYTFYDDFSNNHNNWPPYNSKYGNMSIENGRLNINALLGPVEIVKEFPIYRTKKFEVEVTTKKISGEAQRGFGIIFCSSQDLKSGYIFLIQQDGGFGIEYHENGGDYIVLVNSSTHTIDRWNPSWDKNGYDLKIINKDEYIMIYINNELAHKLTFKGGYGKYFGFFANTDTGVEFSTFKLSGEKE